MRKINTKAAAAVIGAGAIAVAGSGIAFAYWTTSDSGSSSPVANGSSNGTVTLAATFGSGITPGGSKTVSFTATNAGTTDLRVGTVSLSSVSIQKATGNTDPCVVTDFTMPSVAQDFTVPAGTTTAIALPHTGTLTFANDSANSQDGCKGATITLNLSSN